MRVMPVSLLEGGALDSLGSEFLVAGTESSPQTTSEPGNTRGLDPLAGDIQTEFASLTLDAFPPEAAANTIPQTPGDAYWGLLRSMDRSYADVREAAAATAEPGSVVSVNTLLDIQRKTFVYSVTVDFASRVTDRLGQAIQTLMRNQ